jgi:Fic family protein
MQEWNPASCQDLLTAHKLLMKTLVDMAGHFRMGGVGIYRGKTLVHMAPQANRVPELVQNLLDWLNSSSLHPLIKSCIFHYEFEFIHPFEDGNGRMGRLWQTLILSQWQPMLAFLPVETVIWDQQGDYYEALGAADKSSDASPFVEFMLNALYIAMKSVVLNTKSSPKSSSKSSPKNGAKLLNLIAKDPSISTEALGQTLGISKRAVLKQISKLKTQGSLKRIGPAKGGHWKILAD